MQVHALSSMAESHPDTQSGRALMACKMAQEQTISIITLKHLLNQKAQTNILLSPNYQMLDPAWLQYFFLLSQY